MPTLLVPASDLVGRYLRKDEFDPRGRDFVSRVLGVGDIFVNAGAYNGLCTVVAGSSRRQSRNRRCGRAPTGFCWASIGLGRRVAVVSRPVLLGRLDIEQNRAGEFASGVLSWVLSVGYRRVRVVFGSFGSRGG